MQWLVEGCRSTSLWITVYYQSYNHCLISNLILPICIRFYSVFDHTLDISFSIILLSHSNDRDIINKMLPNKIINLAVIRTRNINGSCSDYCTSVGPSAA